MTSELILLLLWRKIKGFRCSLPVNVCKNTFCFTFFIVFHNLFSQGHRFTHITCTGSICNHFLKCGCHFQLWISMHTSAYYLSQNSNFLNCIRRFIHSNECSNSTKFVWALHWNLPRFPHWFQISATTFDISQAKSQLRPPAP